MARPKLLFVDTNILLDFYRGRNEAALRLLKHVEDVAAHLIMSYQVEIEFKKNRQAAILEGMSELKPPSSPPQLGIFSDAKAGKVMARNIKQAGDRLKKLQAKLMLALAEPAKDDPVYKVCQRLFRRKGEIVLSRESAARHTIRRRAFKRFLHGCPPRKKGDTSIGDAFNWEWMLHCCEKTKADLYIVSRDSDFGVTLKEKAYINDHLKQEFADRVSQQGKVFLFTRLSEALKHFEITVTRQEEEVEREMLDQKPLASHEGTLGQLLRGDPDVVWRNLFDLNTIPQPQFSIPGLQRIEPLKTASKIVRKSPKNV